MARKYAFDVSKEMQIIRYENGVKLIKPTPLVYPSVDDLFSLPFNIYFLSPESIIQDMSETTANLCGFYSRKDAIGKTARAVSKRESAEFSIQHNNEVLTNKSIVIKNEHFLRLDDFEFYDLAIKYPLFNDNGKIIGIFGCSIPLDILAQSVQTLIKTGLLSDNRMFHSNTNLIFLDDKSDHYPYTIEKIKSLFTKKFKQHIRQREAECLFYILKGKSAREIGPILNLSPRTIEYYLNTLKDKLNCKKKSEMINMVIDLLSY
ncbi:LuxR family transcriptional regulator [Legionella busanensis]|uniref:LuxR family transcriptional regulator n=1 Tax=Legionella busanensis TaxID=190655 RepID=A0A378JNA1_9GAMM|nr:LuxR C-terminal-related transcriptional regulator [Legionella busanensis]STX51763.1 LuxR family transcriptional regulator [Legionella busanensis]